MTRSLPERAARSIATLAAFWAGATAASACEKRQDFFRDTEEGSVAHLLNARTAGEAQSLYDYWCPVRNQQIVRTSREKVYFAINDRSDTVGTPRYYLVKIFRHSPETVLNPLLYLRRSGPWANNRCDRRWRDPFEYRAVGRAAVTSFFNELDMVNPPDRRSCNAYQHWLGLAYGRPHLSLLDDVSFLRRPPRAVAETGIGNWSVNFLAAAYLTRPARRSGNTVFRVTRDGADRLFVQVSNGSRSWVFEIRG